METLIRKLQSRKFWLALGGTALAFGASVGIYEQDTAVTVAEALSIPVYIVMEGAADALDRRRSS